MIQIRFAAFVLMLSGLICNETIAAQRPAPPALTFSSLLNPTPANQEWVRKNSDQFSWMLFALISNHVGDSCQNLNGTNKTNNLFWETWPSDDDTFPVTGEKSTWLDCTITSDETHHLLMTKTLHPDPLLVLLRTSAVDHSRTQPAAVQALRAHLLPPAGGGEEVRRNPVAFRYIGDNGLGTQHGIAEFVQSGKQIVFPAGSIEVKAFWIPWRNDYPLPYHWNYASDGRKYILSGLHISTKVLPEWTWATFEWIGNPERCSVTGCNDHFGEVPCCVATRPATQEHSLPYPAGTLKSKVTRLFTTAHANADELRGYRLKGSQILDKGKPTPSPLGNSQIEGFILETSSCLACHEHARAYVKTGQADPCLGESKDSQTGIIDFLAAAALMDENSRLGFVSTDFVWAFRATHGTDVQEVCND